MSETYARCCKVNQHSLSLCMCSTRTGRRLGPWPRTQGIWYLIKKDPCSVLVHQVLECLLESHYDNDSHNVKGALL